MPLIEDDTHSEMFYCLGKALSSWQLLESGVGQLFSLVVAGQLNSPVALAAYNSIQSFNARLQMLDAAITASSDLTSMLPEWKKLRDCAKKKNDVRNRFAHFAVVHDTDKKQTFLLPNPIKAEKFNASISGQFVRYTEKDVHRASEDFDSLAIGMISFSEKLRKKISVSG